MWIISRSRWLKPWAWKAAKDYYDRAGAMRDMVQNHLMQLLCLIAMEPPAKFDPDAVRDEKLKVIRALDAVKPDDVVRGQYQPDGRTRPAISQPCRRTATATTESFVALKAHISNWRWAGTPFYLRTGKRLKERASEIAVVFKDAPHSIFGVEAGRHRNILTIKLQPNEGIELGVTIKEPGPGRHAPDRCAAGHDLRRDCLGKRPSSLRMPMSG